MVFTPKFTYKTALNNGRIPYTGAHGYKPLLLSGRPRDNVYSNHFITCKETLAYNIVFNKTRLVLYSHTTALDNIANSMRLINQFEQEMGWRTKSSYGKWANNTTAVVVKIAPNWGTSRLAASVFTLLLRGGATFRPNSTVREWLRNGNNAATTSDKTHLNATGNLLNVMLDRQTFYILPGKPEPRNPTQWNSYNTYLVYFNNSNRILTGTRVTEIGGVAIRNIRTPAGTPLQNVYIQPDGSYIATFR